MSAPAVLSPRSLPGARGRLDARGEPELLAEVADELGEACARGVKAAGVHSGAGGRAYFKYGPVPGKAGPRLFLRRTLFGVPYPPHAELRNLSWLRDAGFEAPEPLLAGVVLRRSVPRFRFFYTREVPDRVTLERFLAESEPARRAPALGRLAEEAARMHVLGFVHRDLFPRNVLVDPAEPTRLTYLDAWRGGPGPDLRGPLEDLACFDVEAAERLSAEEREAFLTRYLEARETLGRPLRRGQVEASLARRRARLARRARSRAAGPR